MNAPVPRSYGFPRIAILLGFSIIVAVVALKITSTMNRPVLPEGMVLIPGGEFIMGMNNEMPHEGPAHRVHVDAFWIDETEVTNKQFKQFVEATGYLTTAERPVDWNQLKTQFEPGAEKPPDDKLIPGSVVFSPPRSNDTSEVLAQWWEWKPGASWKHPEGRESNLDGRWDHPVVHVSWEDAAAYARWAGKRLPTEAEWEFAARGRIKQARFAWGNELNPEGKPRANYWQGTFPIDNTCTDGFAGTSPVKSFPPNGYGIYDMIGNVWEWTADWYRPDTYVARAGNLTVNPQGPAESWIPNAPRAQRRTTRGGSFLCAENFCTNYRPSARQGNDWDTGTSHIGFRCVIATDLRK